METTTLTVDPSSLPVSFGRKRLLQLGDSGHQTCHAFPSKGKAQSGNMCESIRAQNMSRWPRKAPKSPIEDIGAVAEQGDRDDELWVINNITV
jgi:hypothetical protein